MLAEGRLTNLHPLSELPHPIIVKASESVGQDPGEDNHNGPVRCSSKIPLLEIKAGQWRGGVWEDLESGVCWLVVAGLAKGEHEDRDDFYKVVERGEQLGHSPRWLPTDLDQKLLKQETAARALTEWELEIQTLLASGLSGITEGGDLRLEIFHPLKRRERMAAVQVTIDQVRDPDYESDDVVVEILFDPKHSGSSLSWQLTTRVLITLSPPEQGWDRYKDTYSNIAEPGFWETRARQLASKVESQELAQSEPGTCGHYAHRDHLAGSTIDGRGVRALCGVFFVPTQDHEELPVCPKCSSRFGELPQV